MLLYGCGKYVDRYYIDTAASTLAQNHRCCMQDRYFFFFFLLEELNPECLRTDGWSCIEIEKHMYSRFLFLLRLCVEVVFLFCFNFKGKYWEENRTPLQSRKTSNSYIWNETCVNNSRCTYRILTNTSTIPFNVKRLSKSLRIKDYTVLGNKI